MPPALLVPLEVLDHACPDTGRWLRVLDTGSAIEVSAGKSAERNGRRMRSLVRSWRIGPLGDHLEVLATHPVREIITPRFGDVADALIGEIRRAGGQPGAFRDAVARRTEVEATTGPLSVVLAAAAFPLLRSGLAGGSPIRSVPEVLVPLLRADDARSGTRAMFGRVTRPLIRAVAQRLDGADGPVFPPLLVATMAAGTCGPERLIEIIATDPAVSWTTAEFRPLDVTRARGMFAGVPPRQVVETLQQVLRDPNGPGAFADQVASWHPSLPAPRPLAPERPPIPQPRVARPADGHPPVPAPDAPATPEPPVSGPIHYPPAWRAAEGTTVAGHRVALPRDARDLHHWGQVLRNCLGSYGPAATVGRARLVGLVRNRELRYVAEITPGGVIRQIEGAGNRRPNRQVGNEIARGLIALGLASADGRTGQSLLPPRPR